MNDYFLLVFSFICGYISNIIINKYKNTLNKSINSKILHLDENPQDDVNDSNKNKNNEYNGFEELKMVLCVRSDLKMSSGKIAAQCAHGAVARIEDCIKHNDPYYKAWKRRGCAKIALKVPDEEIFHDIADEAERNGLGYDVIADAGRTQIASGSLTVLAIGPAPISKIDEITGPRGKFPLKLL